MIIKATDKLSSDPNASVRIGQRTRKTNGGSPFITETKPETFQAIVYAFERYECLFVFHSYSVVSYGDYARSRANLQHIIVLFYRILYTPLYQDLYCIYVASVRVLRYQKQCVHITIGEGDIHELYSVDFYRTCVYLIVNAPVEITIHFVWNSTIEEYL